MAVSPPITEKLARIDPWKRCVFYVPLPNSDSEHVAVVTREFHDAFVAELVERMQRLAVQES